uniref:AFP-like domain-containing protein n=1 Tax=Sinocyclocheilus grahami TaxID=75366 RepID=A0A672JSF3_SINGR
MAVEFLQELNVPFFKVGSGDTNNFPYLKKTAQKGAIFILKCIIIIILGKSVVAKTAIPKGTELTLDMLTVKVAEPKGVAPEDIFQNLAFSSPSKSSMILSVKGTTLSVFHDKPCLYSL